MRVGAGYAAMGAGKNSSPASVAFFYGGHRATAAAGSLRGRKSGFSAQARNCDTRVWGFRLLRELRERLGGRALDLRVRDGIVVERGYVSRGIGGEAPLGDIEFNY